MIPDKLQKIMKQDGVVAIATLGPGGLQVDHQPHKLIRAAGIQRKGAKTQRRKADNENSQKEAGGTGGSQILARPCPRRFPRPP